MVKNKKRIIIIGIVVLIALVVSFNYSRLLFLFSGRKIGNKPVLEVNVNDYVEQSSNIKKKSPGQLLVDQLAIKGTVLDEADIYEYNNTSFVDDFKDAVGLASKMGFPKEKVVVQERDGEIMGHTTMVSYNNKHLLISKSRKYILYYVDNPTLTEIGINPDVDMYKKSADTFLKETGLYRDIFVYARYGFREAVASESKIVNFPNNARIVEIQYESVQGSIPVIDTSVPTGPNTIKLWLNKEAEVVKMDYQWIGDIGSKVASVQLKTIDELKEDILSGKSKFVYSQLSPFEYAFRTSVKTARLSFYPVEGYLVPVYILRGDQMVTGGRTLSGYFIIKAVK